MKKIIFSFLFLYISMGGLYAQSCGKETNTLRPLWTVDPFDLDVFIPNGGQLNKVPFQNQVLYNVSYGPLNFYFTENGLIYAHAEPDTTYKNLSPEQLKEKAKELKASGADTITPKIDYVNLTWVGANTDAVITAEEQQTGFYGYYVEGHDIHVNVYKKLVYHDLYPGIDVEYTFPESKNGRKYSSMKYALIVHPGANISKVKLNYAGTTAALKTDSDGNIIVSTPMGDFIDHAPVSYYRGETKSANIATNYAIQGNTESFSIKGVRDKSRTMIIDPTFTWNTDPAFTDSPDKAYIVHSDNAGDVYVYGGGITSATPAAGPSFQLVQLNSSGVVQWTYNNPEHESVILWMLSGMAVDQCNGAAYIDWSGAGSGADEILEISKEGNLCTGIKPTIIGGVDPFDNIITYSSKQPAIFIGTGDKGYQRIEFDTNLTLIAQNAGTETDNDHNAVMQALSPRQDTMFMVTNTSSSTTYFDSLISYPTANLANTNLLSFGTAGAGKSVTHFHQLINQKNFVNFSNSGIVESNVFNGMAASNKYLYVYDGDTIAQLSKKTGLATANGKARLGPEVDFETTSGGRGQTWWWGGIAVDTCADNLYVGFMDSINVYSGTSATPFALVSKTVMPANTDTVYSLELKGNYDTLYAAGEGFVAALAPSAASCSSVELPECSASTCSIPLPITLLYFNCATESGGIGLSWATATETNNKYFTIERSGDGVNFYPLTTIPGAGNSAFTRYYTYKDAEPLNGTNYYRLSQTDYYGNTQQDNISACNDDEQDDDMLKVYPNPSIGTFSVQLPYEAAQTSSTLVLYDLLGRAVYSQTEQNQQTVNISVSNLATGLYILNIITTQKTYVTKLLITK